MPLVTITFTLRQRRVLLDADDDLAEPPPGLPQEWTTKTYIATWQAKDGIQEVPGQVQVLDVTRRNVLVIVPKTALTGDPSTWPTLNVLGYDRTIGGPEVLNPDCSDLDQCNPNVAGLHYVSGTVEPPARVFWIDGELKSDVKKWPGAPQGWPYIIGP